VVPRKIILINYQFVVRDLYYVVRVSISLKLFIVLILDLDFATKETSGFLISLSSESFLHVHLNSLC
jgi:hypothetical protein